MWIKVCGCVDAENARAVADCGVDAIGLNFFSRSKRFIGTNAQAVRDAIGDAAEAIGLFVDEPAETILEAAERYRLDAIQLHGHESAEMVRSLAPRLVIRAVRVPAGAIATTVGDVIDEHTHAENLSAILLDAASTAGLGGTGESIDWDELAGCDRSFWPTTVLAGGLTPSNVAEAVRVCRPDGVDVASGVELRPGWKDIAALRKFADEARRAAGVL